MKKKYEKPLVELVAFDAEEELLSNQDDASANLGGGEIIPDWD